MFMVKALLIFVHFNCTLKFCSVKFKVKNVENLIAYLRLWIAYLNYTTLVSHN